MTTFSMMEPLSVFEQPFFPITKTSVLAASFYFATQEEHYKVKLTYRILFRGMFYIFSR